MTKRLPFFLTLLIFLMAGIFSADGKGATFMPQGGVTATITIRQVYDPEVEFLEIGQGVSTGSGAIGWSWKVYGVDLSGTFGGLDVLGGLEAVRDEKGVWRGIASDWWGNATAWVERAGEKVTWNGSHFGAWGNVAGYNTAVQDGKAPLHQLLGYRGLTVDPPGFHQMGLRAYDPLAGTWLSPDPLGHDGSLSLYDYCDNDPANRADPDGRFGKAVGNMAGSAWRSASVGVATYLTGYSGNTSSMSAGQIWSSYRSSSAGVIHAQQWDTALNWIPVVNVVKWTSEGISGRNFITGADLSVGQQIGAVFNVGVSVLPVTMGAWSSSATAIGSGSTFSNPNVIKGGFLKPSNPWGAPTPSAGTMNTGGTATLNFNFTQPTRTLGGASPVRIGQAGESVSSQLIGLPKNNTRIPSASGNRAYRVPDHMSSNQRYIAETKNVDYQYYSSQLKDDKAHVLRGGGAGRVDVIIDHRTTISSQLLREYLNPGSPIKLRSANFRD